MAYDEALAGRFRAALAGRPGITEKRMMVGGCDWAKGGAGRFMFRLGPDNDAAGAALPGGEPMVQGGRRMRGFFFVDEACADAVFARWLDTAFGFASALPPK
ncbi:MAG: hypothetical protein VW405_16880 [Rhodospirillaceae bacterium]